MIDSLSGVFLCGNTGGTVFKKRLQRKKKLKIVLSPNSKLTHLFITQIQENRLSQRPR